MICSSVFLSIFIFFISASTFALDCVRYHNKFFILTEYESSTAKRLLLTKSFCQNSVLTLKFENSSILRLRFESSYNHLKTDWRYYLEGSISARKQPVRVTISQLDDRSLIKMRDELIFQLDTITAPQALTPIGLLQSPIARQQTDPQWAKKIPSHGKFGNPRKDNRLHTAIDIPAEKSAKLCATGVGQVIYISHLKTQSSIFIKHMSHQKKEFYTALAHVKDIEVKVGQYVNPSTTIARALTNSEFKKTKHKYNHIHFEVRKTISDLGHYSISTRDLAKLHQNFLDPELALTSGVSW